MLQPKEGLFESIKTVATMHNNTCEFINVRRERLDLSFK